MKTELKEKLTVSTKFFMNHKDNVWDSEFCGHVNILLQVLLDTETVNSMLTATIAVEGVFSIGKQYKVVAIGEKDVVVIADNGRKEHVSRNWFE